MAIKKTKASPSAAAKFDPVMFSLFEYSPRKGDLRKIEILETALKIIAEEGIEGVSNESIGKRLKIRRSHVAYYFKNKADIVEMSIRYAYSKGQAITRDTVIEKGTPRERFVGMVDAGFEWAVRNPDLVGVTLVFYHYCTYNDRYRELMSTVRQAGLSHMRVHLEAALEEKGASATFTEVLNFCKLIQGLAFGNIFEFFGTQPRNELSALKEVKKRTVKAAEELLKDFISSHQKT